MNKICKKCLLSKSLDEFPIHSVKGDKVYYRAFCIICDREYRAQYRESHPELKIYQKEYKKTYYIENKDTLLEYQRNYLADVRENNPSRKIRENVSRSINYHLKLNNSSKNGKSILNFLDYSIDELRLHLETKFEPWMNWNNYGIYNSKSWIDNDPTTWTWQIDHIIPHSTFSYTSMDDQLFRDCWALSNLRPYSSKQNILDGLVKTRHKKLR